MSATSPAETVPARRRTYAVGNVVADKYQLERLLDEGGMGSVWLATNLDLDASVAIKLLRSDAVELGAADRMKREARVEARLEHRAIVRVFDCGQTQDGDPFIVMELLDGRCLADTLDQNGPMSAVAAVQTVLPIVDGLSAAHDKGIVHRDVKPGNIFLAHEARRLQPKIVDFGIATLGRVTLDPKITLRGAVIGSPSYMSPEQARGLANVDHRADIWGICAVLYEAVANRPPFRGDTYDAILRSIVEDDVAPLEDPAAKNLWPILERGLDKERERRFQSMRQLGVLLAGFLLDQGITDDVCGDSLAASWAPVDEPERLERTVPNGLSRARRAAASSESDVAVAPDEMTTEPNRAAPSPSTSSIRSSMLLRVGAGNRKRRVPRSFLAAGAALAALALVVWQAVALSADSGPAAPGLVSAVASESVFPVAPVASEAATIRVAPVLPAPSPRVLTYESLPHEYVVYPRGNAPKASGNRPQRDTRSGTRGESSLVNDETLGLKTPSYGAIRFTRPAEKSAIE